METLTQPGYKHTELGWIPEEWEIYRFKELLSDVIDNRGKTPPYQNDGEFELLETNSISFALKHPDYRKVLKFVDNQTFLNWFRKHPKKGDILISTVGEYSGATVILEKTRGTIAQNLIALRVKEQYSDEYIFYCSRSDIFKMQLSEVMMNQAQPSLRVPWLLGFKFSIPSSLSEQQAIATGLSDMDSYIRSLEQLIEKKKAIKQAAMQELLTPKEDWEVRKLGELGKIKKGKGIKKDEVLESGFPCVRYGELYTNFEFVIGETVSFINNESATNSVKIIKGDILFAGSGETKEEIGKCATFLQEEGFAGGDIIILTPFKSDPLFLGYLLNTREVVKQKTRMGQGDAVVHIYPSAISEIVVSLPKSINIQKEIGMLIRSFEEDILLLELNLKKCFLIKQAMMQDLLTGKVRLV